MLLQVHHQLLETVVKGLLVRQQRDLSPSAGVAIVTVAPSEILATNVALRVTTFPLILDTVVPDATPNPVTVSPTEIPLEFSSVIVCGEPAAAGSAVALNCLHKILLDPVGVQKVSRLLLIKPLE